MKAGLVQMDIIWEDVESNKKKAESYFAMAKEQNVDILTFPEMSLTGFSMNVGKTTADWKGQVDFFCKMSQKYSMAVVFGYPAAAKKDSAEADDIAAKKDSAEPSGTADEKKRYENHLAIIDRGKVLMDYTKIHPFSYGAEAKYFQGGDRVCTTIWQDTVLGGFVCYDLRFPEIFQISSRESEIIFVIANWPESRIAHWDILLQARAIENQCYIVAVNRTGDGGKLHYNGHSAVYGPTGERLTRLVEEEALLTADIDLDKLREYREYFPVKKDRREKMYQKFWKQMAND